MPIIQWEDTDTLCNGIYELLVLTYLQGLILFCGDLSVFDESGLKISQKRWFGPLMGMSAYLFARIKVSN